MDLDLELDGVTFIGPSLSEETERQVLDLLPSSLASILRTINGFVALGGAIHLRGICQEPAWHSLALVWRGEYALYLLNIYPPLCTTESRRHIQVAAAPALEEIRYLSDVARQISRLPPGTRFRIKIQ